MSGSGIVWQEPPAVKSATSQAKENDRVARELRANPGAWALVKVACPSTGNAAVWKKRGLKTRIVQVSKTPPRFDIYARFVEEES